MSIFLGLGKSAGLAAMSFREVLLGLLRGSKKSGKEELKRTEELHRTSFFRDCRDRGLGSGDVPQ